MLGPNNSFRVENESQVEMPIGGFVEKYLQTAEPEEPEQPEVFESVPEVPQEPEVFESVPEVPPEWEIPMEEIPEIEVPQIETPEVVEEVEGKRGRCLRLKRKSWRNLRRSVQPAGLGMLSLYQLGWRGKVRNKKLIRRRIRLG